MTWRGRRVHRWSKPWTGIAMILGVICPSPQRRHQSFLLPYGHHYQGHLKMSLENPGFPLSWTKQCFENKIGRGFCFLVFPPMFLFPVPVLLQKKSLSMLLRLWAWRAKRGPRVRWRVKLRVMLMRIFQRLATLRDTTWKRWRSLGMHGRHAASNTRARMAIHWSQKTMQILFHDSVIQNFWGIYVNDFLNVSISFFGGGFFHTESQPTLCAPNFRQWKCCSATAPMWWSALAAAARHLIAARARSPGRSTVDQEQHGQWQCREQTFLCDLTGLHV